MKENPSSKEFLLIFDECADSIFRLCYAKTSNRDEARDMVQETFTRVWERVSSGKERIENLRAFTYTVARNLVKDYYKKKKPVLERDLPEGILEQMPADIPEGSLSAESQVILRALGALPEQYRETLTLHLVEGLPIGEIAERLGERPNTISVRLKRGIEKVRTILHVDI